MFDHLKLKSLTPTGHTRVAATHSTDPQKNNHLDRPSANGMQAGACCGLPACECPTPIGEEWGTCLSNRLLDVSQDSTQYCFRQARPVGRTKRSISWG